MTRLDSHISTVRTRMTAALFLTALAWAVIAFAVAFVVMAALDRLFQVHVPRLGVIVYASLAGALVAGVVYAVVRRPTSYHAAVEIDQRLDLKEKFSTALYARASDDPFARAAVLDAEKSADNVSLRGRFPIEFPRQALFALLACVVAILAWWLLPEYDLLGKKARQEAVLAQEMKKDEAKKAVERAQVQVQEQAKVFANNEQIQQAKKELEQALARAPKDPEQAKRSAAKALQDVAEAVKEQVEKNKAYATAQTDQKLMRGMSPPGNEKGPVADAQRSIAKGDFSEAITDLKKAVDQFDKMNEQQKQAAARQMQQMAKQLQQMAQNPQNQQQVQQQLQQMGMNQQQAQQVAKQMQQMAQNPQAAQQMQQMAQQMISQMPAAQQQQAMQMLQQMMAQAQTQQQAQQMAQAAQQMAQAMQQQAQQGQQQQQQQQQQGQKQGQQQQAQGQQQQQQGGQQQQQPGQQMAQGQQQGGQQQQQQGGQQGQQQQGGQQQGQGAQQQMAQAQQQMQQQLQQMQAIQQDMAQQQAMAQAAQQAAQDAANGLNPNHGQGQGNQGQQQQAGNQGPGGQGQWNQGNPNQKGNGAGQAGIGNGPRDGKAQAPYTLKAEQAPVQNNDNGKTLASFMVKADTVKGEAKQQLKDVVAAVKQDAPDEVDQEMIGRQSQKAVRDYFKSMDDATK